METNKNNIEQTVVTEELASLENSRENTIENLMTDVVKDIEDENEFLEKEISKDDEVVDYNDSFVKQLLGINVGLVA